ncbi:MAG: RsmE family RNA methyltransferase [Treponema sp.]|nr:RsmE family RNA methyltransferase [Treponema sp.]
MRQYVSERAPDKNGLLTVSGKDYRYMKQVLRLTAGDMVQVRLPDGRLQNTTVCKVNESERTIILQVCAETGVAVNQPQNVAALDIWLFQFVARGAKMDTIVRQATECGVSTIVPVLGAFSQAGGSEKNFRSERLLRIVKEARQQSGSAVDTRILDALTLEQAVALWHEHCGENAFAAVLYERTEETVPLHKAVAGKEIQRAALAVGAEGGISPEEIVLLRQGGFVPVHFKTNILRCETAALYGIAALQNAITEHEIWQCKE